MKPKGSSLCSIELATGLYYEPDESAPHPPTILFKHISTRMGTGGSFPGVKRPGREADHSPRTTAEVKKMWIYTSTPPYAFMA
jgi:hypothetical protein